MQVFVGSRDYYKKTPSFSTFDKQLTIIPAAKALAIVLQNSQHLGHLVDGGLEAQEMKITSMQVLQNHK